MNPKSFIKPVVLITVDVVTALAVSTALTRAVHRVIPDLGVWNGEWTRKEKAIQAAKLIGISVGTGVIAGLAATAVRSATEQIIWSDDHRIIEPQVEI